MILFCIILWGIITCEKPIEIDEDFFKVVGTFIKDSNESPWEDHFEYPPFTTKKSLYYIKTRKNCDIKEEKCNHLFGMELQHPIPSSSFEEVEITSIPSFYKFCNFIGPVSKLSSFIVISLQKSKDVEKCSYYIFNEDTKEITEIDEFPYLLNFHGVSWNNVTILHVQNRNNESKMNITFIHSDGSYSGYQVSDSENGILFPSLRPNHVPTKIISNDPYKYRFENEETMYFIEDKYHNFAKLFRITKSLEIEYIRILDDNLNIQDGKVLDYEKCNLFLAVKNFICVVSDDGEYVNIRIDGGGRPTKINKLDYRVYPFKDGFVFFGSKDTYNNDNLRFRKISCFEKLCERKKIMFKFDERNYDPFREHLPLSRSLNDHERNNLAVTKHTGIDIMGYKYNEDNTISVSANQFDKFVVGGYYNNFIVDVIIQHDDNMRSHPIIVGPPLDSSIRYIFAGFPKKISFHSIALRAVFRFIEEDEKDEKLWMMMFVDITNSTQLILFNWNINDEEYGLCFPACDKTGTKECSLRKCKCFKDEKNGFYSSSSLSFKRCDICAEHYFTKKCNKKCIASLNCFGNGRCGNEDGDCICSNEFYNPIGNCENCHLGRDRFQSCKKCLPGFIEEGKGREGVSEECIPLECMGKFQVIHMYVQDMNSCNEWKCFGYLMNSHSVCSSSSGQCVSTDYCNCFEGYRGEKCEIAQRKKQSFWLASLFVVACLVPSCSIMISIFLYISVLKRKRKNERRGDDGRMVYQQMRSFNELDSEEEEEEEKRDEDDDENYDDTEFFLKKDNTN